MLSLPEIGRCVQYLRSSEKVAIDTTFVSTMIRTLGVNPATQIIPIARNTYLIEFVNTPNMNSVLDNVPWNFRMDLVVVRKANDPADLSPDLSPMQKYGCRYTIYVWRHFLLGGCN
jgi:hypothetical protein